MTTANQINVYDISVEARVALRDLLALNPAIVPDMSLAPGTQLARPCYVSGAPTYFGADMAQVRCHPSLVVTVLVSRVRGMAQRISQGVMRLCALKAWSCIRE